jgi:hypothetical protein
MGIEKSIGTIGAAVVLAILVTVAASHASPTASNLGVSPDSTGLASHVTLTAEVSLPSEVNRSYSSSPSGAAVFDLSHEVQERFNYSLNTSGVFIEGIDYPLIVKPNEEFNVTVYTAYNLSEEMNISVYLTDYDALVEDLILALIDWRNATVSGIGTKSFGFDTLVITLPEIANVTALVVYETEDQKLVKFDDRAFQITALNFSIDAVNHPTTVIPSETFNVTVGTSYDVAPGTVIGVALFDFDAGSYINVREETFSGTGNKTVTLGLEAPSTGEMLLSADAYLYNKYADGWRLIGYKNFSVPVISLWVAGAEYFVDSPGVDGTGDAMNASDGTFNSFTEVVSARVPTSGLTVGTHGLYVHGMDSKGEWGDVEYVVLNVTCPFTISDLDFPTSVTQDNYFSVNADTHYSFSSETKSKICVYNRETGELLGSSSEKALAGIGIERFSANVRATAPKMIARAYYQDDEQQWVSRDSSDLSITVTSPITISNVNYPEKVALYNFFTVSVTTLYSFGTETTAKVSVYNRDTGELLDSEDKSGLKGTGSQQFRIDGVARSAGVLNLSARVDYLDEEFNWITGDRSDDFTISVYKP